MIFCPMVHGSDFWASEITEHSRNTGSKISNIINSWFLIRTIVVSHPILNKMADIVYDKCDDNRMVSQGITIGPQFRGGSIFSTYDVRHENKIHTVRSIFLHSYFFSVSLLLSSFWTSCGLRCRPFSPPVRAFSVYRA